MSSHWVLGIQHMNLKGHKHAQINNNNSDNDVGTSYILQGFAFLEAYLYNDLIYISHLLC